MQNNSTKIHPAYQRKFFDEGLKMVLDFLQETLKGQNKVIEILQPKDLMKQIDFTLNDQPCQKSQLIQICKDILNKQTKPYHPHFHNQLFGGFDQYSVFGGMMAPAINGSVYTYQIAPCFTLMENQVYKKMKDLLGWDCIDGVFTPGGSFANFMAITTSRFQLNPNFKKQGMFGSKPLKIFTSQTSHYSMKKGANMCGIGQNNLVYVKADAEGRMIPEDLQKAIKQQKQKGNICMLVNATFGTTVQGNIDPIQKIAQICEKHKIWCHVDAALGGALIFSQKQMKNLNMQNSLKKIDSITIDPHKGLVVPLQLSYFLVRRDSVLFQCNSAKADYLFHKERASYSGNLDCGDKSFQCGRVIDILKFWTYLKGNGMKQIANQVQRQCNLAQYCKKFVLKNSQKWKLVVNEVQTINVCFWYIPQQIRNLELNQETFEKLGKVTVLAKKYMIDEGKMLCGYSKSQVKHYFWRTVMSNPFLQQKDVDYQMELMAQYCERAFSALKESKQI